MNNIVKFTGDDQPIHFGWELIDTCQYRCSYCYFLKSLKKRPTEKYLNNYRTVLSRLKLKKIGEVIVIDDCSNDNTNYLSKKGNAKVIKQLEIYITLLALQKAPNDAKKLLQLLLNYVINRKK